MNNIISKIEKFVKEECSKSTSKYGYEPFQNHFVPVVKYANRLSKELGGNKEVILISAWMHDIGAIIRGRKNHHITGAKIAETRLRELKYPEEKIKLVKNCILNHRGSTKSKRITLEEKIIAEADTMANFDNLPGIFAAAFMCENLNQAEARVSAKNKLKNCWGKLHFKSSKKIIQPKYEAAMLLLK
jgi:uncharacterized protein